MTLIRMLSATFKPTYKFFFIPLEASNNPDAANVLRVALGTAWNHLSWLQEGDFNDRMITGSVEPIARAIIELLMKISLEKNRQCDRFCFSFFVERRFM